MQSSQGAERMRLAHCPVPPAAGTDTVRAWEAAGAQLLLNSDPSHGLLSFVEPQLMGPEGQHTERAVRERAPARAPRRLVGYRQPRRAPAPSGEAAGSWQQQRLGIKRAWDVTQP
jgi:hypothetical protein